MTSVPKHDPETNKNPADHSGYKIGYSKPPLDSRWRKGQCPNRKGRGPRKGGEMESYGDLVVRNSNEKITIYENGTERCVPKRVHLATRVVNRGIAGDPEEEKILTKFERPDLRPPAGARHIVDVDSEDEIPARERELRRRKHRANTGAPSLAKFAPGRPRHDAPFGELIKRELNKRIEVQENGRTLWITKREFWMRRLWNDAMNGKPGALRLYMKLARPNDPPPEDSFFWIIGGPQQRRHSNWHLCSRSRSTGAVLPLLSRSCSVSPLEPKTPGSLRVRA